MAEANVRLRVDGRDAVNQLNRVNKAAGTLQGTVGKLVGAFAGIQAAKFVFFKTAELETQTRSLKVLTGSLGNAQKIIKELQQFGAVTPFTSSELIETAKRLKAFGFETEKIVDVTKRLGDIAGATGADLGGIATAFGQIQAKGRLQGEELLQLQERGVDLQGTLRKEYGLTAEEFQKALSQGRIGADAVSFALEKLTEKGGKYANGAIAQSDTLSGKLSTLQDGVDTLARQLGEVLSPVLKGVFDQAIQTLNAVNRLIAAGRGGAFNRAIGGIGASITFGATSQALDDAERFLEQVSSQKNRAGIEQNIQALTQLSNALKRIPATDPNAATAVALQGRIMQMQSQNLAALQRLPAAAETMQQINIPELGGGTRGGAGGAGQERVDASKELLELNQRLFESAKPLSELEKINLEYQIEKQEILDRNLLPREREIALLEAAAGFEEDLLGYRKEQIELQDKAAKKAADARKQMEEAEQRRLEADPGFQMKQQLEELLKVENQVAAGATAIGNAFSNSLKSVVNGSKSAEQALADMMASVAEHFLDMAAKIIAQQLAMILYGTIMKALGVSMPGGGGAQMSNTNYFDPTTGLGVAGPNFGLAEGGYVSGPTNALVGEGGEPEYVIPESKMRESMARYSRGARGSSVIPDSGVSGTSGEGGGVAVAAPIDVRYTVERINSVDYVTADQFQRGLQQAAAQGATQGEQRALTTLRQNTSQRKRIGL
jgi:tape measure domain-containing protein